MKFPDRLQIGSGSTVHYAKNHAICDGPAIVASVNGGGYPGAVGWSPETEALAAEMVRRYNREPDLARALEAAKVALHLAIQTDELTGFLGPKIRAAFITARDEAAAVLVNAGLAS